MIYSFTHTKALKSLTVFAGQLHSQSATERITLELRQVLGVYNFNMKQKLVLSEIQFFICFVYISV